jgi:thiamine-phosphate pyrophosphorylase
MNKEEKLRIFTNALLYPVTSEVHSKGRSDIEVLYAIARGGAKVVQLRDKFSSKRVFYEKALRFREITNEYGMLLIINDYVDIALSVNADGVHLGQDDLPLTAARRIAPDLLIGVSTHNKEEILRAQEEGADYINIGPIFDTKTREGHLNFLGIEGLKELSKYARIPFSVMGGIKMRHIPQLIQAGARLIAMVTEITEAEDITGRVRELIGIIKSNLR